MEESHEGNLAYPLRSAEELAGCLIAHGILEEEAWYQSEDFDGGDLRGRVYAMLDAVCDANGADAIRECKDQVENSGSDLPVWWFLPQESLELQSLRGEVKGSLFVSEEWPMEIRSSRSGMFRTNFGDLFALGSEATAFAMGRAEAWLDGPRDGEARDFLELCKNGPPPVHCFYRSLLEAPDWLSRACHEWGFVNRYLKEMAHDGVTEIDMEEMARLAIEALNEISREQFDALAMGMGPGVVGSHEGTKAQREGSR